MKTIAALHRPEPADVLLGDDVRARLAAARATRLQVNVDDADVAAAMRFGPGERVTALVSVWGAEPGDVLDVVLGLDRDAHAWSVRELRPLEPPAVADGRRTDALANVALLRRPATMPHDAWLADWLDRHTAVAIATQGTFGYVQNPVLETLTPGGTDVAGIVEELFPMAAISDPHAFHGTHGDDAELQRRFEELMDSCARFGASDGLDLVPTSRYTWSLA